MRNRYIDREREREREREGNAERGRGRERRDNKSTTYLNHLSFFFQFFHPTKNRNRLIFIDLLLSLFFFFTATPFSVFTLHLIIIFFFFFFFSSLCLLPTSFRRRGTSTGFGKCTRGRARYTRPSRLGCRLSSIVVRTPS